MGIQKHKLRANKRRGKKQSQFYGNSVQSSPDSKVGPLKRAQISRINRAFLIIKEGIPDTV